MIATARDFGNHSWKRVTQNLKPFSYGVLTFAVLLWCIAITLAKRKKPATGRPRSPDPEKPASRRQSTFKAPARTPGTWPPSEFKRPAPEPLVDWDVHTSEPLPYRPFKHGPYHITMGLRTMQWDEWIELDNHYLKFHADKKRRIEERGEKCCRTAPEAMDGAIELLEELYATMSHQHVFRCQTLYAYHTAASITSHNAIPCSLGAQPLA